MPSMACCTGTGVAALFSDRTRRLAWIGGLALGMGCLIPLSGVWRQGL